MTGGVGGEGGSRGARSGVGWGRGGGVRGPRWSRVLRKARWGPQGHLGAEQGRADPVSQSRGTVIPVHLWCSLVRECPLHDRTAGF